MIDAYETGYPVEEDIYGLPASKGGLSPVTGFTRPVGSQIAQPLQARHLGWHR
jgi:hypothetical protein